MMYLQQGVLQKGVRVFTKRGLSWVSVGHRDTWGKLDGVWRRGTAQEVMVVLDPPTQTLYWDYNLWELLGRPAEELNVQIVVGKHALLCGSLHPTDPKPCLDLTGGWALTTKFDVYLHGIMLGASGWGGDPPVMQPDLLPINGRETAANHVASVVTDNYVVDYGRNNGSVIGLYTPRGNIYGQLFPASRGGRGGDCLRTNRPTTLHIMEGDDYIGMVLPGGGGGASLPSYWRRFVGEMRSYVNPNVGGLSGLFSVTDKYKQWSLAGWGGAIGCGASAALGVAGPAGHPYTLSTIGDVSPPATPTLTVCVAHGRPVRPFNREGMWAAPQTDGWSTYSSAAHPATNVPGRTASSGHGRGSDVYHAPLSELSASGRILPNDLQYSNHGGTAFTFIGQGSLSLADFNKIRSRFSPLGKSYFGRRLEMYERRDFNGGMLASPEYVFDKLNALTFVSGRGGTFGGTGFPSSMSVSPYLGTGGFYQITKYAQAWTDPDVFGFSAFCYSAPGGFGVGGAAGRAVVGSEYVTVVGRKLTQPSPVTGQAYNWIGASVPFE